MAARRRWVVYAEVKKAVSLEQVLVHYGLRGQMARRGGQLVGPCPIHDGSNPRQFKVSTVKNAYKCFGCGAGGNVLDFVAAIEKVGVRDAALLLSDWFSLDKPTTSHAGWRRTQD